MRPDDATPPLDSAGALLRADAQRARGEAAPTCRTCFYWEPMWGTPTGDCSVKGATTHESFGCRRHFVPLCDDGDQTDDT